MNLPRNNNNTNKYYYNGDICRGVDMMTTSNCKFINNNEEVYNTPYSQYIYPATAFRPTYPCFPLHLPYLYKRTDPEVKNVINNNMGETD